MARFFKLVKYFFRKGTGLIFYATNMTNIKLNILLVEDDDDDILFFKEAVEKLEVVKELSVAKDCNDLFNRLNANAVFDIIFLDINLPIMNGKQCLKEIKAHPKYKDVPIIIFTGSNRQEDVDAVYEYGAHYHVVKPYAHINYIASLKIILDKNWKETPPQPAKENFVVDLSFN
jgi:CheY-like chemotaxis protein